MRDGDGMRRRNLFMFAWLVALLLVALPGYIWLAVYHDGKIAGLQLGFPAVLFTLAIGYSIPLVCNHLGQKHLDQGIALAESGDPLSARASFERAQGLVHADDPRAEHYLGLLSLRLWDVPAALVHLERASTIVSRPPEYWVAVALLGSAPNLPREAPALARVIAACRARDFAAASELVAAGPRPDSEGTLSALWDMLACWTAVERGQPPPTASAVELFAETAPERLRTHWPELVDFALRRASLDATSPRVDAEHISTR
jgi:hypothetical protein